MSTRNGLGVALLSAAAFALSGPFAKALLEAGWSPGAAVLVRVAGGAVLLLPAVVLAWRRRPPTGRDRMTVLLYGMAAVAGAQVCFFSAVQTLSVGVGLLLEYLAPVLLVGLHWVRRTHVPGRATITGAVLSMVGLVLVLDPGGAAIDPVGVLWGLGAAVCLAVYFEVSARVDDDLPPALLAGGGLAVGAVAIGVLGLAGVLPLRTTTATVQVLGTDTSWLVPALVLVLVSSALAYLTGIVAAARLGARVASFVGLSEVLFAVLFAWLLLDELPGPLQLLGGVAVVAGVALVRADRTADGEPAGTTDPALVA